MPKFPTFPTLYDDALQICMSKLRAWDYVAHDRFSHGTLSWMRNGEQFASISILVNTLVEEPYIELDYKYGGTPRKYKIVLVTIPSNLGSGNIWYFKCPATDKRCRKLYSVDGYFLHREAFSGCMYESQTKSRKWRQVAKVFDGIHQLEEAYEVFNSKYFKPYYAGKETKRYKQLKQLIESNNRFSSDMINSLFIN